MKTREVCGVDDPVGPGEHKHQCENCMCIWKHNGIELLILGIEKLYEEAHSCPRCNRKEFWKMGATKEDKAAG